MYIWILWGSWLLAVVGARYLRNRFYAIFMGINLAICVAVWSGLFAAQVRADAWWLPLVYALQLATFLHYLALTRPKLRPVWYRAVISIPGLWFAASTLLAFPWAIAAACGFTPHGWWIPFVVCLVGVYQSLVSRKEDVYLQLDGQDIGAQQRLRFHHTPSMSIPPADASVQAAKAPAETESKPASATGGSDTQALSGLRRLRIAQIADPHAGPFMSAARLRGICERIVQAAPDLVLITGDLLTMESQGEGKALRWAMEPLKAFEGKIFGCLGNHDHEAPQTIVDLYKHIGGTLLVDRAATVETPVGTVEIIGADFVYRKRQQHLHHLFAAIGMQGEHPRILLLHDPAAFWHVPDGAADLTLAGHSHGGQVGLQSLGIPWTLIGAFTRAPDYGFWGKGRNRLYVHRGNGHYGFPLRLGVSGEESILHVDWT